MMYMVEHLNKSTHYGNSLFFRRFTYEWLTLQYEQECLICAMISEEDINHIKIGIKDKAGDILYFQFLNKFHEKAKTNSSLVQNFPNSCPGHIL